MPEWAVVALGVLAVPLVFILGAIGVASFAIWALHKGKMARLEIEEKERQAELDRELLGLGSKDISANLQVILDRLNTVEHRLDKIEAMQGIETARGRTATVEPPSAESEAARRSRTESELA